MGSFLCIYNSANFFNNDQCFILLLWENNRHFNDTTHLTNLFGGQDRGAVHDSLE